MFSNGILLKKSVRISKKTTKAASTFGAILFWVFAALILISNLFTGSLYIFLIAFSMSAAIALLGWLMFFMGNRRFRSKAVWSAYPNKGEQILFRFSSDGFISTQGHLETKVSYISGAQMGKNTRYNKISVIEHTGNFFFSVCGYS